MAKLPNHNCRLRQPGSTWCHMQATASNSYLENAPLVVDNAEGKVLIGRPSCEAQDASGSCNRVREAVTTGSGLIPVQSDTTTTVNPVLKSRVSMSTMYDYKALHSKQGAHRLARWGPCLSCRWAPPSCPVALDRKC
jgi:hypothetical protein